MLILIWNECETVFTAAGSEVVVLLEVEVVEEEVEEELEEVEEMRRWRRRWRRRCTQEVEEEVEEVEVEEEEEVEEEANEVEVEEWYYKGRSFFKDSNNVVYANDGGEVGDAIGTYDPIKMTVRKINN